MSRRKILFVFGTRPEAIKLAPLALAMKENPALDVILASSGQHQKLLHEALDSFDLKVDYDSDIMQKAKGLASLTAHILEASHALICELEPAIVIVHGDTTSTLSAALAAYYAQIPIAHVEAGLRTMQKYHSFPEETNRRMVATIADLHFAPSESARQNLLAEHISDSTIEVTGNTVIDAVQWILTHKADPFTKDHPLSALIAKPFILVTAHRRESWGEIHRNYFDALQLIAQKNPQMPILFPIHPNPLLREEAKKILTAANIHLLEPQEYCQFVFLMKRASMIITDSGSIQEEVTFLGKPTIVIREMTERVDAVKAGNVIMAEGASNTLAEKVLTLLADPDTLQSMSQPSEVYGDGHASLRIMKRILQWLDSQ